MYNLLVFSFLVPLASSALGLLLMRYKRAHQCISNSRSPKQSKKEHLRAIGDKSELAASVLGLIDRDGAGDVSKRGFAISD